MATLGFQVAALLMIGFVAISWIAGTFFGSDERSKTLDEITAEHYAGEIDENGWLLSSEEQQGAAQHS